MHDLHTQTLTVNDDTYAAWNAHDADAIARVFAEDAVLREAGRPVEIHGRDAIRARAAMLLHAFPDLRLERLDLLIDGDRHADRWVLTGTHRGELFGMPPTGKPVRIEGATFTRLNADGLVIEDIHFTDLGALMAQLT